MEDCWEKKLLIGYVPKDAHLSKDSTKLLTRIADEEEKYYWKWLEGDEEVKDADDTTVIVLNQLRIVNTRLADKIFINTPSGKIGGTYWKEKERPNQDETLIAPPIAISPAGSYTHNGQDYYGVYITTSARLLFLDNREDTQKFQYGKKDASNDYERKRTYKYNRKRKNGTINSLSESTSDDDFEYFLGDGYKNYRYFVKLKKKINQMRASFGTTHINQIRGSVFKNTNNSENKLLEKIKFKQSDGSTIDDGRTEAEKKAAKDVAKMGACELPIGNYHCFYHNKKGSLTGHISNVHIGEGGSGGSGYPMRADKVSEVNYRWDIALPVNHSDRPLAKLWSYLFELDPGFQLTAPVSIQKNQTKNTSNAFYPTNWPYAKTAGAVFATQVPDMDSLLKYYKTFKASASVTRRNKPDKNPFPPRITNPKIAVYDYKFDIKALNTSVKLNNTSYRVWKKINTVGGSDLILGINKNDREDAGKTMAEALSDYDVYALMKKSDITPKITNSKLSATAFAKYVLGPLNDNAIKEQWHSDNELASSTTVDKDSLKTDQEWCHLFGHGDGGSEELGNFVSGSKHCNTEQLAIETGQRRVSQNKTDFLQKERNKLKAKITAYLIPNAGVWVSGKTYQDADLNKTLFKNVDKDAVKNKGYEFFEAVPETDPVQYRLKLKTDVSDTVNDALLRDEFEKLSDEINKHSETTADEKKKKKELFQLRRNLENHFFMYLPIARWMRYKIYYDNVKVFDHIYDAQSESMNLHECQILDYTLERTLYEAISKMNNKMNNKDMMPLYKQKIKERVEKLVPTQEEAEIMQKVLQLDQKLYLLFNNLKQIDAFSDEILGKINSLKTNLSQSPLNIPTLTKDVEDIKKGYNNMNQLITGAKDKIGTQETTYTEIKKAFNTQLTQQQQNQSKLKNIVVDTGLNAKILYLKGEVGTLNAKLVEINSSIAKIETELAKPTPHTSPMNLQAVGIAEGAKVLKEKRKAICQEDAVLDQDEVRPLKRLKSMSDNYQQVT